jgi:hypothetical protein
MLPISIVTVEAATPCEYSVKNPMLKVRAFILYLFGVPVYFIPMDVRFSTYFEGHRQ